MDLAVLQIIGRQFHEAEETLLASLDFTTFDNPVIACNLAFLFEAQDRLYDAAMAIATLWRGPVGPENESLDDALQRRDTCAYITGMGGLIYGRMGLTNEASQFVELLLTGKAKDPLTTSSVEVAIGLIGLGQYDDATNWLRRAAMEEDDPMAMWFHIFPPLRHLQRHDGFKELLQSLGLQRDR